MTARPAEKAHILCLNSGSSSLKFALYRMDGREEALLAEGAVERIGLSEGRLWLRAEHGTAPEEERRDFPGPGEAVAAAFAALERRLPRPGAVGHRVVHGGADHAAPERVEGRLLETLRRLVPFAPLHLPAEIAVIEAVAARFPDLPQVACFDTAFHRRMPEVAQRFPLDRALWNEGLRRYGFHGLSYEYIVEALGPGAGGRTVIAHLGNGASLAAVRDGRPLDTTMGFTPTGGLMMGTRCGDLDPGVLIHLAQARGWDAARLERLVNHESGLLGVSGISPDMKTLLERREHEPAAARAVELFCHILRKQIGAMAAVLGGLETLVFTGGIGERAAPVRREVCQGLAHLGVRLDEAKNACHAEVITAPGSPCAVRVIPTDEDRMIARHTRALVFPPG